MEEQKVMEETQKVVEKAAEVAAETVNNASVPNKKAILKSNGLAVAAGFAGGVAVIAAAKPVWKLTKKAGSLVVGLVKKPFKKESGTVEEKPAEALAEKSGEK